MSYYVCYHLLSLFFLLNRKKVFRYLYLVYQKRTRIGLTVNRIRDTRIDDLRWRSRISFCCAWWMRQSELLLLLKFSNDMRFIRVVNSPRTNRFVRRYSSRFNCNDDSSGNKSRYCWKRWSIRWNSSIKCWNSSRWCSSLNKTSFQCEKRSWKCKRS